jgi:hypothetical protein
LDCILKWVENPESERGLVLLGQAGTGKSSIAHEVARRLEKNRLGSYFAFLRKEQSKDEAYQLFTTLARDLSDRYPAFKLALGQVIKDNSSLRGARDYRTLFEYLLLEPLKDLQLGDPIIIIVDALDESGDAIGKSGLHTFLAQHLSTSPRNSAYSSHHGRRMGSNLRFPVHYPFGSSKWMMPYSLPRRSKTLACILRRSSLPICSETMVSN